MKSSKKNHAIAVVMLSLSMWFIACEGTVVEGGIEDNAVPNSCVVVCEQQHPVGLKSYHNVMGICACETCNTSCTKSVCGRKEPPSDACLPCALDSLSMCKEFGLFKTTCLNKEDCSALVDCLLACDPQTN